MATCLKSKMQVFEYNPMQIKQAAAGSGKADKKAVEKMVRMQLKIPASEKLLDDAIDALGVGLTHQVMRKSQTLPPK
jgi:crossover junction endodeoxyribonuclease RuvC